MTDSVLHQTIESLERVLPELEAQEGQLRGQLQDVVQRVISARQALEHLRVLTGSSAALPQPTAPAVVAASASSVQAPALDGPSLEAGQAVVASEAPEAPATAADGSENGSEGSTSTVPKPRAGASPRTKPSGPRKRAAKKAAAKSGTPAKPKAQKAAAKRTEAVPAGAKRAERLADAALEVLKKASEPMRAGEINTALGREATPGQIESVRNTLDRLAKKNGRITRPSRGTYAAV